MRKSAAWVVLSVVSIAACDAKSNAPESSAERPHTALMAVPPAEPQATATAAASAAVGVDGKEIALPAQAPAADFAMAPKQGTLDKGGVASSAPAAKVASRPARGGADLAALSEAKPSPVFDHICPNTET